MAANLGARAVHQAAGALERALAARTPCADLPPALLEFRATLGDFVDRLRAALPPAGAATTTATPIPVPDPAHVKQAMAEMIQYLDHFDPAAVECLETKRAVFQAVLPGDAFAAFEREVTGFAFADALARLRSAAKGNGVASK